MSIAYNLGIPASGNNPSQDQPNMQTNNDNIGTYVAVDHVGFISSGDTGTSGRHKQTTFDNNYVPALPTAISSGNNIGVLFTNPVASGTVNQLFYYAGSAAQSSAQYSITGTGGTGSGGSTMLLGGIIVKWGVVAASDNVTIPFATASGSAFPNQCLGVSLTLYTSSAAAANAMILSVSPTPILTAFTPRIRTSAGTTGSATIFYLAFGY